ncbi:MAG: relaxase/mobilization nuclease domain-containing protein, partial [Acidobacteriaceae bacterium]|nr:relaxase/mobilization nuclease domain-containing protein [Acidobacteriaceae bacterium]
MIIKGNRHNHGAKLARYLITPGQGERAQLAELRGFGSHDDDIVNAFRFVHVMAEAQAIKNPFFHVQVRLPADEELQPEQWQHTADRIEERLGLTNQPRAVSFHIDEQTGDRHMHIAFSLIDGETLKAKELPFFKMRLKSLARELERELDLTRVKNEREGPIKYAAKKQETEQARRLDYDKDEFRNTVRACWDLSQDGRSFESELAVHGLMLAAGDQRGLVVVNEQGGVISLGKRLLDINKKAMLEHLADLPLENLPSVDQARSLLQELSAEQEIKRQGPKQSEATLTAELDRVLVELDNLKRQEQEKQEPLWDRDQANRAWEDSIINAAIEKEERGQQFVEPTPEKAEGVIRMYRGIGNNVWPAMPGEALFFS